MRKIPPGYFPILLIFAILLVGCTNNSSENNEGGVFLTGKLEGSQPITLYLEELTPSEIIPLDTIRTNQEGRFQHTLRVKNAGFYRIRTTQTDFITLAVEPGEKLEINAHADQLKETYTVTGSHGSRILWQLNQKILEGIAKADSLRTIYHEYRFNSQFHNVKQDLQNHYNKIVEQQEKFAISVIEENPQSLASILALYQYFEDNVLLNDTAHFEYFEKLSKSLCSNYPSNKHVINLKKRVNDLKRQNAERLKNEQNLELGNIAPDITLPDHEGNSLSLSSLEGNVVLIDFWAAWCPPCREANHILKDLYAQHKNQGFEIYAVSLDRTREQWLKAIDKDSITWKQVSDMRFMNSPVVSLYMVTEVPHYVLLDRERRIIARNFRINELEDLLKENL
jgi:peroxiredoxin